MNGFRGVSTKTQLASMSYVFKNEMPQLYQVFQKLSMDSYHTYQGGFFKANVSAVTIAPQRCVLL